MTYLGISVFNALIGLIAVFAGMGSPYYVDKQIENRFAYRTRSTIFALVGYTRTFATMIVLNVIFYRL